MISQYAIGPKVDPGPIHASIIPPGPSPTVPVAVTESAENVLQGIYYTMYVCIII